MRRPLTRGRLKIPMNNSAPKSGSLYLPPLSRLLGPAHSDLFMRRYGRLDLRKDGEKFPVDPENPRTALLRTPNPPTNIVDFREFDSSIILI